jgi:hypothetical protein
MKSTASFPEFPDTMERHLKRTIGSKRPFPASPVTDKKPVAKSDQQLHSVLATLEECRVVLAGNASGQAAQLVSVAILELRMKLNRIADSELKLLCDAISRNDAPVARPQFPKPPQDRPCGALLKLVK